MKRNLSLLVEESFFYTKMSYLKYIVVTLSKVSCLALSIYVGAYVSDCISSRPEGLLTIVSIMVSWFISYGIAEVLHEKLFLKKVKIFGSQQELLVVIDNREFRFKRNEVQKVKTKLESIKGRGTTHQSTKLIIKTVDQTFHFTVNKRITDVEKINWFSQE